MTIVIHCPQCAKRYQVAEALAGKQVRCQQCQTAFTATPPAPELPPAEPLSPLDPLGVGDPLSESNLSPLGTAPSLPAAPLGGNYASRASFGAPAGVSNPSGGPTDTTMRLVCGGMVAAGLILVFGSLGLLVVEGSLYLLPVALAPLALILGTAGLISPDVVRAMGKYGGHLTWQYKAVGFGLLGLYFAILVLLLIGFFAAGFEPDRPGRPRAEFPAGDRIPLLENGPKSL
jgi:predicted Zn finger-like uncharacterized protein